VTASPIHEVVEERRGAANLPEICSVHEIVGEHHLSALRQRGVDA
jgi:hypothetical protein